MTSVHVVDEGHGPPVVLLHGQPGRARDWDLVSARLRADHRVLAPDRPGYGGTPGPARGFAANADEAVGLLDERGIDTATFVGHSWGGGVALAAAQRHPQRVAALVLVASVGTRTALQAFDRLLAVPVLGDSLAFVGFRLLGRVVLAPHVRAAVAREVDVIPLPDLRARVQEWRQASVWRTFAAEQRALVAQTPALEDALGSIDVPTTVVAGERDSMVPARAAADLADAIPAARLVRLPDVGHLLPYEAPDAVADAIATTVARVRR